MTEQRIPWSAVVEGDQVKSPKTGKFYEVVWTAKMMDGVHLRLIGVPKEIVRPTAAEPMANVQRGATGNAVDVWIEVLSSGGR